MNYIYNSVRISVRISTVLFLVMVFSCAAARAVTFDWASPPAGAWNTVLTTGNSETVDYFQGGSGFGVAVTVANTGQTITAENGATGAPAVFTTGTGFLDGGTNTRGLIFNVTAAVATTSNSQITIKFNYVGGVNNVTFAIWDVDGNNAGYLDNIANISATAVGGATVFPTTFSSQAAGFNTITGSGATLTATGTTPAANTGASANQGNINVAFTQNVTSITFQYSNAFTGTRTQQHIGIGDITFTANGAAFPEVNSSGAALMLCGGVIGFGLVRRRRGADRSPCESYA